MDFKTYQSFSLDLPASRVKDPHEHRKLLKSLIVSEDNQYNPCEEAYPKANIPLGKFTRFSDWNGSGVFPGTTRNVSIHCTDKVSSVENPAFMFFNDGDGYAYRDGPVRATHVLDNLVHRGEIPPTVAVFVNPGISESEPEQRSVEYDTVSDRFLTFINTEIVPFVEENTQLTLSSDPKMRLACGMSSGGICAFNAAWHSPESFGLVLSHCGSYTNIRGGHNFPSMIRRLPRKPIRVFLQSGKNDLNTIPGNWPIANQDMAASLDWADYDFKFEFGEGAHSLRHGGAIFADSLRWLFREWSS